MHENPVLQHVYNMLIIEVMSSPTVSFKMGFSPAVREAARGPSVGALRRYQGGTCCCCQSPVGNSRSNHTLPCPCLAISLRQWARCAEERNGLYLGWPPHSQTNRARCRGPAACRAVLESRLRCCHRKAWGQRAADGPDLHVKPHCSIKNCKYHSLFQRWFKCGQNGKYI